MGRERGIGAAEIAALDGFRHSDLFSPREQAALAYAEALTQTPASVPGPVFEELGRHFGAEQILDLSASIALENYRARLNRGLDIGSDGFCR